MKEIPISLDNIFSFLIFILLCFLGVFGRIAYDVEVKNKKYTLKSFFNRFFITIILCYISEIFILKNKVLKEYYSQIIIIISFFSVDLVRFFADNAATIALYLLNIFNKGFADLITGIKKSKKEINK